MAHLEISTRILSSLAVIIAFLIATGCQGKEGGNEIQRPAVSGVTIASVNGSTVTESVEATGIVRSDRTSVVAARMMGTVTDVFVREGDPVKAGQLLLTIESRDTVERARGAALSVEEAKQQRDLAESTWKRYKNLYEDKALTKQEMDQVETQKKIAQAQYERAKTLAEEAKTYQNYTRVTAPFSGRVTEKRIDAGSMASPGLPLLVIEAAGRYYIEAALDESLQSMVRTGMTVQVGVDALKRTYEGQVTAVIPAVDPHSRTFKIKVEIKDQALASGIFTRVRIPTGNKEVLLVPESAIVRKGQLTGVYVVNNRNILSYRLVRTGAVYASGMEILSGLAPRERIIVRGTERAMDGGVVSGGTAK